MLRHALVMTVLTCAVVHAQTPLRLNHLQMKGTHNSYHVKTPPSLPVWDATQLSYSQQAATQQVRAFEIDINWDNGYLNVYHFKTYDAGSTCQTFFICLSDLYNNWFKSLASQPNPPIVFIQIEAKSAFNTSQWDTVDNVINTIIPRNQLIIPADVQGNFSTLREAVIAGQGWPTLDTAGGRFVFFLDQAYPAYFAEPYQTLTNRVAFPGFGPNDAYLTHPLAAVLVLNDPIAQRTQIRDAVSKNYLVRTRADAEVANITIPSSYNETSLRYFTRMDLDANGLVSVDELTNFIATLDSGASIPTAQLNTAVSQLCSGNPTGFNVDVYRCIESKTATYYPAAYPATVLYLFNGNITGSYRGQTILTTNDTLHAALSSGAHFISTDFPGGATGTLQGLGIASNMSYSVSLGAPYVCNPVTTNTCQNNAITLTYVTNIPAPVAPPGTPSPTSSPSSSTSSSFSSSSSSTGAAPPPSSSTRVHITHPIMVYGMSIVMMLLMIFM